MACDSPSSFSSENFSDSGEELVGSQALPIPVNTRGTDIDWNDIPQVTIWDKFGNNAIILTGIMPDKKKLTETVATSNVAADPVPVDETNAVAVVKPKSRAANMTAVSILVTFFWCK